MTDEQNKPPPKPEDESFAFKRLLTKIARVPKAKVDEREREYQAERRRKKRA